MGVFLLHENRIVRESQTIGYLRPRIKGGQRIPECAWRVALRFGTRLWMGAVKLARGGAPKAHLAGRFAHAACGRFLVGDAFKTTRMRPINQGRPDPLPPEDIVKLLKEHIPYRLAHVLDPVPRIPASCIADNQAFEAGAVAGRSLLSFLGIGCDSEQGILRTDRSYHAAANKGFGVFVVLGEVGVNGGLKLSH